MPLLGPIRFGSLLLALGLVGCSSLPVAPVGPVPANAGLRLREYKLRKHHAESLNIGFSTGVKVGAELMDLSQLQTYFELQDDKEEAGMIQQARNNNNLGLGLTVVGTVLLTPVVGLGLLLPYFMYPAFLEHSNSQYVQPAILQYNAHLSRLWLSQGDPPPIPGAPPSPAPALAPEAAAPGAGAPR